MSESKEYRVAVVVGVVCILGPILLGLLWAVTR